MNVHSPQFKELRKKCFLRLLTMHYQSKVGHLGGNLSCLDILLVLYHTILKPEDVVVLSKGHSAGALYIALWSVGLITDEQLEQFHKDNTLLSGHPPASGIPAIAFATGSLGHGVGLAAGVALGKRLKKSPGRVFCLTSDGEWNEGSNWESLIFIQHQVLNQICLIVDLNGLQGFGSTNEIANLHPLDEKFKVFNMETVTIDGHDAQELNRELDKLSEKPRSIIARTRKGSGVSFMENRMEWHYLPLTEDQYNQAIQEISLQ